jgi:hypothetical protein
MNSWPTRVIDYLELLAKTPIDAESRERIRGFIESDFK